jgi:DNA polymerase III delta subunit
LKGKPIFELLPLLRSYEYGYLPEGQRFDWTKKYVEKYGKSITDEAASYLLVSSTEALSELAWKLDHAALFVGETSKIDIISVQRVLGITSSVSIFDLERAIHKGSLQESLKIARRLLEGGEPVLKAIAYLHSSLILLWGVIRIPGIKIDQEEPSGEQRSQREEDLRRVLGKRYWVKDQNGKPAIRDSFVEAAKAVSFPMIERALMGLLDLEITLKTRTVEEDLLFYHWLCQIMLPNGSTPEPQMEAGS